MLALPPMPHASTGATRIFRHRPGFVSEEAPPANAPPSEAMFMIQLLEGWHFITISEKRHYFHGGFSLCRRYAAVCTPTAAELNNSNIAHYYNCVPCERKLKTGSTRRKRRFA